MKTLVLSLILFPLSFAVTGQETFERIYERAGDDLGHAVVSTENGYIIAGTAEGQGANLSDGYLMHLDQAGDTTWTRLLGYKGTDLFNSLVTIGIDTFAAFGTYSHTVPPRSDFYLVKFTGSGDTLWTKTTFTAQNAYGYSAAWTGDGFILCGYQENSKSVPVFLLVRTDSNGDTLWTKTYGGDLSGVGTSVIRSADNTFVACGYIDQADPFNRNIYLLKTTMAGDTLWTRKIGLAGYEVAWSLAQTSDNGYILTGYHWVGTASNASIYVIKTDVMGLVQWDKSYGNSGLDIGYSGIQTGDGGYVFTGFTTVNSGLQSMFLVRTDDTGDTLWTRQFGAYPQSVGYSVSETADNGFIIGGATNSPSGNLYDIYAVKTDDNGMVITGIPEPGSTGPPLTIFPNPTAGNITVTCSFPLTLMNITDIRGRVVMDLGNHDSSGRTLTLDLSLLPPGVYILRARTLQTVITEKIMRK